jgi:succinylglutamic semialdehyde dehydrogenase
MNLFIGGQWKKGTGREFHSFSPYDAELLWSGASATAKDVNEAIKAASEAFEAWSELDLESRLGFIENFVKLLEKNREELAVLISKETGKLIKETRMEVGGMISKFKISTEAYNERCPIKRTELKDGSVSVTRHRPHGVCAVFGPYNFPGHISNGHIMPALIAGNTIVFKPSELSPLVAEYIVGLWEKSQLPAGVLNLVQGAKVTGLALASNSELDALFFTGSSITGRALHQSFGADPSKILALEMGGNNPLVVDTEIKNLDESIDIIINSAYLSNGQRCTCARRLIVVNSDFSESLLDKLVEKVASLKCGNPLDEENFMGPVISQEQMIALIEEQNELKSMGAKVLLEMKPLKDNSALLSPGILDISKIKKKRDKEIFGPLLQVIQVRSFEEAIKEANSTAYGLAAGLISDSQTKYQAFYKKIKAGIINWNTQLTGASSSAPFGGIGLSGNHRPSAYYAADYCSYPVASIERY